ncbi:cell envelope integrity protein CreD [Pseudoalteromonas sp. T1lg75]|uniref:cell envelope integrity protein CreD n=1 Tax=Pseudoalteromonas sp. T1lg75 TaxID=2077102 RepID=UPI000CF679FA|nr:cell envelope integrity protein CreD [Pseudoalteromonas sp. T1lg75]
MRQKLGNKLLIIAGLILLILVPIMLIKGLIFERSERHLQVQQEIARSSSGEQGIIGPFLYLEYVETKHNEQGQSYSVLHKQVLLPSELKWQAQLSTFEKFRGIYKANLYRSQNDISATFNTRKLKGYVDKNITKFNLVMVVQDIRGIGVGSAVKMAGKPLAFQPGSQIKQLADGVHAALDLQGLLANDSVAVQINLNLQGMKRFAIAPVGEETHVSMSADWPHPSFVGDYLPTSSSIDNEQFTAIWQTNFFATNMQELFGNCVRSNGDCSNLRERSLGVNLVDGVDHYLKSHRATNYALLVLVLVFSSFFLLEILRKDAIHPVQYGFVGLAIAVFYLLLVSLSEHFGFNLAYMFSALASGLLLSIYVAGMLHSSRQGVVFFAGIALLYGVLFSLLAAEDYALLMGATLVFAVLSLIMMLTRKFNWYGNNESE